MTLATRSLRAGGREVPLLAGPAALAELPDALARIGFEGRLSVVADRVALEAHEQNLARILPNVPVLPVSGAEEEKTLASVSSLWDWLVEQGAQRRDALF